MTNNYIECLYVKNVRQFNELNIEFSEGFSFLAGPNGCGKTSVLACISHCFEHSNFQYSRFKSDSEFWTDVSYENSKYRVGLGSNSIQQGSSYRSASISRWNAPHSDQGRRAVSLNNIKEKLPNFCPLFIGTNRNIQYKVIQGMSREKETQESINNYTRNSTKSLYGEGNANIKQWLVNRYFMIDKEWAGEERGNWNNLIESLPNIGPFNSNFSFVRIQKDLEPIFSIYGNECYLEELSAGFQAVLSMIAEIFEWIESSNPEGSRNVSSAEGTVLIDELDLHLHPEWQFTLRDGLENIFPRLQFIVTTHSPHLLASAKPNEVIVMPKNDINEIYNLSPSEKIFSGWNTDQILSDVMGVISLENKEYEKLISRAFDQIEQRSIEGLEREITNLEAVCHPNDTIVMVLRARLAGMVANSND